MAILDGLRSRLGRRPRGGEERPVPREMQGWGETIPGGQPWDGGPREETQPEPDILRMARARTTEEDEAYRMGEQMGADAMVEMAGLTPRRRRDGWTGARLMDSERLNKATEILMKYKAGKSSVDKRVIRAQQWWKLRNWQEIRKERHTQGSMERPSNTGWLWNCIVGKHADAIDSFPEPVILPRMEDDKAEAKKLSSIIPVILEMNEFEETYNDAMWQKMQEGTGVYGVFWDKNKLNGLGDIDIRKVNILNLYWEPGITNIQDSKNVFFVSFEDKEDLEKQHPELEGQLRSNKLSVEKYITDDSVDLSGKAPVIDWYYKVWKDGRTILHYCKYVGETCLYSSEEINPDVGFYSDGNYPFVLDALYPVEGSPAGYGYIDIARDSQADIDTLSQAMVKNAAMSATPRYFMRKDGGVNEKEFANWANPIVHVNGSLGQEALRPIEVGSMTNDSITMLQNKIDEIKFITGNTDVNNGGVPAGVTAASAIAALKEDSGRSSKDSTKAAYRSYRLIICMVIERIRQFYDIPRQFRIMGQENGQETFETYSNEGLKMQTIPNGGMMEDGLRMPVFDVEVRAQRENAYTKMSQNELALQFWSNGMLNPQMSDQALIVLDMMEFRGKDELMRKVRSQGTMQDTMVQIAQIALQLAQKYDPAAAEGIAQVVQGVMADAGVQPQGGAGVNLAPADEMSAPHDPKENAVVRKASERAANASRPN